MKNNLKALIIYFVMMPIFFCMDFMLAYHSSAKVSSQEELIARAIYEKSGNAFKIIIFLFIYYCLARRFLKRQGSFIQNIKSVSWVSLLGIIFVLLNIRSFNANSNFSILDVGAFIYFYPYVPRYKIASLKQLIVCIMFMILPALVMALAINYKEQE
ncbi:hypothetical protein [Desnuesiella massiliensis]|uniref:hypothetical protein n=1 Tax=Desnuesiella massiliensis TaxID=1650662 RepID=UPI0006E2F934|nr:hypothetical protein [Desnuesiella massiliensis]